MDIKKLKLSRKPSTLSPKGSIDDLQGGNLEGWAAQIGINEPLVVAAYTSEGELLGYGKADQLREDLLEHGVNEGYHGFSIAINEDNLSPGSEIVLKDYITHKTIQTNSYVTPTYDKQLSVSVDSVIKNRLNFTVTSSVAIGTAVLRFSHKGIAFCDHAIESDSTHLSDHIWLPAVLLNGHENQVDIHVVGAHDRAGWGIVNSDPILTPSEYLTHSNTSQSFISRQAGADWRYESLVLQLDNCGGDASAIDRITTAHRVLVESHEGRKYYPKLSLPFCKQPQFSIIIPGYNKFELTYHAIASIILSYNECSYEVIIADDCSTDETSEAENLIENIVISRNKDNLRFLRSCNKASRLAKGNFIVFLNNDTEVKSHWLDALYEQHAIDESIGLTGSKLLNLDGTLQEAGGIVWGNGEPWNAGRNENPFAPEWNYAREVDYLTGAAMCIKADVWKEVGGFSDEFAPCYYEDADLAFKVREAGYRTVYVPHSEVIHFEGQSHGTDLKKGLKAYQKVNEKTFRAKWFKQFRNRVKPSLTELQLEKDRNIEQRVLVLDYAIPQPNQDAGSYAAVEEMKLMRALGFKVTFVPDNLAHMGKFNRQLEALGIEVLTVPFYVSVRDVLERRLDEMDAVYITRYSVAEKYIDVIKAKGKPVIFNNADLHFLREIRAAITAEDEELLTSALQTKKAELAVCKKADAILCYNDKEHAVITSHIYESDKLFITPWVLGERQFKTPIDEREGITFLGGFNHMPNIEAVLFLVEEVMPKVLASNPDIKLYVYGSKMPESISKLETENIKMVGFAESLDDVFNNHKLFVAPLLSGAGIKGKVLEAMAYGTPSVVTDVAAEGTGLVNNVNAVITNNASDFAAAIVDLYSDNEKCQNFSEATRILSADKFSRSSGLAKFREIFESVGLYTTR